MRLDPVADVADDPVGAPGRLPAEVAADLASIGQVDPEVDAPRLGDRGDRDGLAGLLDAEPGELEERDRPLLAPADVVDPAVPDLGRLELEQDQVEEVVHVEDVADLLAVAAEAGVAERSLENMA